MTAGMGVEIRRCLPAWMNLQAGPPFLLEYAF